MMNIFAIPALMDNYIWTLVKDRHVIVIDPSEAVPVLAFLTDKGLTLSAVLITHHHHDHIGGVPELVKHYPQAQIIAHKEHGVSTTQTVKEGDSINLLGYDFGVWLTAGHTDSHLSYLCQIDGVWRVFCGDTLFSGGCGRVFTGTVEALFDSFARFNTLPADTLFYPAHEYTLSNLRFALTLADEALTPTLEQATTEVQTCLAQGRSSLPTSLDHQRQINVFLRTSDKALIDKLAKLYPEQRSQLSEPVGVFALLRELKNNFC